MAGFELLKYFSKVKDRENHAEHEGIPKEHCVMMLAIKVVMPVTKDIRCRRLLLELAHAPQISENRLKVCNCLAQLNMDARRPGHIPSFFFIKEALRNFHSHILNANQVEIDADHTRGKNNATWGCVSAFP